MPQSLPLRLANPARAWRDALVDLLFPPRCVVCHDRGPLFCEACCARIQRIQEPVCARCGRPLVHAPCWYCHASPLQIDGLRAVAFFQGPLRQAIHRFKYKRCADLAAPFGRLLFDYLQTHPLPFDVIVPVPLHARREQERGYNQARLLAVELAMYAERPMWYNVVERTRATAPQVELDAARRRENVREAFAAGPAVAGLRILLVDDVCTTGATLQACGVALLERGAQSVWGLALARGR